MKPEGTDAKQVLRNELLKDSITILERKGK